MILSYSSYWPFRSNLPTTCSNLRLLRASLVGRVGWFTFLWILHRLQVDRSYGCQRGQKHTGNTTAQNWLMLIALAARDFRHLLFPVTLKSIQGEFSQLQVVPIFPTLCAVLVLMVAYSLAPKIRCMGIWGLVTLSSIFTPLRWL